MKKIIELFFFKFKTFFYKQKKKEIVNKEKELITVCRHCHQFIFFILNELVKNYSEDSLLLILNKEKIEVIELSLRLAQYLHNKQYKEIDNISPLIIELICSSLLEQELYEELHLIKNQLNQENNFFKQK